MINEVEKVLISESEIKAKIKELASTLNNDYEGKNPLVVCILKGSVFFFADLMREITTPLTIDFMAVSSYGSGTTTSGELKIKKDLSEQIENRHVIVVEDIIDTGNTLLMLKNYLSIKKPASLKILTLLDKPSRRLVDLTPDYCGFVIPDEFVIGYGLDYDEKFRNLKEVCVLSRSVYEK